MIISSINKPENRQDVDAALAAVSALTETIVDEPRPASGAVSSSLQQRLARRLARRSWTGYIGAPILSLFNIQTWTRACWKKNPVPLQRWRWQVVRLKFNISPLLVQGHGQRQQHRPQGKAQNNPATSKLLLQGKQNNERHVQGRCLVRSPGFK